MHPNYSRIARAVCEAGRRLYDRGYVASNDGNISARAGRNRILITPSGISKGFMKPSDLVVVDLEGRIVAGRRKPSSEMAMHLQYYRERNDVNSVCHAHPPYATAFAVAGIPLDQPLLPEVIITLGTIPLVPYATPGTSKLTEQLLPYVKPYDALLLANHGVVTVGTDVGSAHEKLEIVEHAARITLHARQLGSAMILDPGEVEKLTALRERFGVRADVGKNIRL